MLPRVATTTGALQPSLALQAGASVDAAAKPQPSTAALANLRAEVLLRLIETMLKHMPRTGEASPSRDLLETLLTALKTLPGREGDNGRKLADIIAKLPPELRPSVEKLIGTVLSAMPTRSLVEIVRNPNGPEAQKLANLLATSLTAEDLPAAGAERQQKPLGLTAQQLAAVGRHGTQQPLQNQGDARALQTTLKRIFDLESGKPRPLPGQAQTIDADADQPLPVGTNRLPAEGNTTMRAETRLSSPAALLPGDEQPVEASAAMSRHIGETEEAEAAAPAAKRGDVSAKAPLTNAAGQALARNVLQAVVRDVPHAVLMQAAAQLMENLSPEEANFLRALLERPLDPETEQALALIHADQSEEAEAAAAQTGKARPETTQSTSALPQPATDRDEPLPVPHARDGAQAAALADSTPDRLLPAAVLREGVPLAFVPYLPAEEDLEWPGGREQDKDEAGDEDAPDGEDADGEAAGSDGEDDAGEPETPDMAQRREKAAEMVGVIEPGLVFYQKLGDYWT